MRPHIFIYNVYFHAYFLKIFDFEDLLCTVAASYCCWYAFVWPEAAHFYLQCLILCLFPKNLQILKIFWCTVAASFCCWYTFVWPEAAHFYLQCLISCIFTKNLRFWGCFQMKYTIYFRKHYSELHRYWLCLVCFLYYKDMYWTIVI